MTDFQKTYETEIQPKLMKELGISNAMALPRLKKIMVNTSTGDFLKDKKNLEQALEDLKTITGQKPKVTQARLSVSTFKLREGDKIGLCVTLRGKRMYDFYEKLVKIVFPRVKDFHGVDDKSLDGNGNITVGFEENTVFPEIDPGKVEKIRSLQVTIVTSAKNNDQARKMFEATGMKFKKEN